MSAQLAVVLGLLAAAIAIFAIDRPRMDVVALFSGQTLLIASAPYRVHEPRSPASKGLVAQLRQGPLKPFLFF